MSNPLRALLCVVAGFAIMVASAMIDHRMSNGPWRAGFAFIGTQPDVPDLIPFVEYRPPKTDHQFAGWTSHKILFIEFEHDDWTSILAEGDVPRPGEHEALAGVLCGPEEIIVRGETYRVSGRMRRDIGGLSTVYAIPFDAEVTNPLLDTELAREGFYDPYAQRRVLESEDINTEEIAPLFVHDSVPMPRGVPYAVLAGLALTLYGAAVLQWHVVLFLHRLSGAFNGLVIAARDHPRLFRFIHSLNYSAFLYVMLAGILSPQASLTAAQWVYEVFSEGQLQDLGQAYMDGNIPLAAWRTFHNNFIVQTFLLSTLPSLVIPYFGVGKTLLSITVVGFAMAPIWSGGTESLTFHWITIALELQAYILVSFGICVYTRQAWQTIINQFGEHDEETPTSNQGFRFGFEALASATMYACLALAIAALYEAVTLIALGAFAGG